MIPADKKGPSKLRRSSYLLGVAAILHGFVSISLLILGRMGRFDALVDHRGLGRFASDSGQYFGHAANLAATLRADGIAAWWTASFPFHVKLYSLFIAAFAPLVGYNVLAIEPLNLVCFVTVLVVVFKLGNEVGGRRVGFTSAIVVGAWPTFLLHSTQILKDQLFIPAFLALILICTRLLARRFDLRTGLLTGVLGAAVITWLWAVKADLWELSLLVLLITIAFAAVRAARERAVASGNLLAAALLLASLFAVPQLLNKYRKPNPHPLLTVSGTGSSQVIQINRAPGEPDPIQPPSRSSKGLARLREKMAWARYLYASYPGTTSTIDPQVRLENWGQVIRYVPRALEIALFAPFPNTWLGAGAKVGRGGRILSGLEMIVMYLVYGLVGVAMWRKKAQLSMWFLLMVAVGPLLALSLVTANLGALYRLRYPFWMLLIILGVVGWSAWRLSTVPRAVARGSGHSL